MKGFTVNSALFLLSIIIFACMLEIVSRLIVEPIDILLPTLEADNKLGHRIKPGSGGHDAWGFRNKRIPESAWGVAIGDSMTYGISSTHKGAWPSQLSKLTNKTVYNMGIGGWGPIQYMYLLKTKAKQLRPNTVIVGFYVGNDLFDIYNRTKKEKKITNVSIDSNSSTSALKSFRDMLARNSVVYRLISQSSLFNFVRHREASKKEDVIFVDGHYLNPKKKHALIDIETAHIGKALQRFGEILTDIASEMKKNNIRIILLLIPTKETVLFESIREKLEKKNLQIYEKLIQTEKRIFDRIADTTTRLGIDTINILPVFRKSVSRGDFIYPFNDGHPNAMGYGIIAREIYQNVTSHINAP